MCIGKGMLIIRGNDRPFHLPEHNHHEPLIVASKVRDNVEPVTRQFARVEVKPLGSLTSMKPSDWTATWDEPSVLPGWLDEQKERWLSECIREMVEIVVPDWIANGMRDGIDLRGTKLTDLGKLTSIGGDFYAPEGLTDLGKLTSIGGYFYARGTKLTDLGKLTSIGRDFYAPEGLTDLGKLTSIGRDFYAPEGLTDLGKLTSIGRDFYAPEGLCPDVTAKLHAISNRRVR